MKWFFSCLSCRTMKSLWETRISPNVVYSLQHLQNDTSTLVVGGIDGALRVLDQNTGEVLSRCVMDIGSASSSSNKVSGVIERNEGRRLSAGCCIDRIPKTIRPPITCLAVGMKKVVTTHNSKYIRLWKFNYSDKYLWLLPEFNLKCTCSVALFHQFLPCTLIRTFLFL